MSFNIKSTDTPAAIKALLQADAYVPDYLKAAATAFCDNVFGDGQHVTIETCGHVDAGSGIGSVMFNICTAPAPVPAAAPAGGTETQDDVAGVTSAPAADTGAATAPLPLTADENAKATAIMTEAISVAGDATAAEIKKEVAAGTFAV